MCIRDRSQPYSHLTKIIVASEYLCEIRNLIKITLLKQGFQFFLYANVNKFQPILTTAQKPGHEIARNSHEEESRVQCEQRR